MKPPKKPDIPGFEPPELPMSWKWGERMDQTTGMGVLRLLSRLGAEERAELRNYNDWARNRFIIPTKATNAVIEAFEPYDQSSLLDVLTTGGPHEDVMRRFEQQFLGLPPNDSSDGLRWWASNAGGESGVYPVEAVSAILGLTADELITHVQEAKSAQHSFVMIRADEYLFAINENQHNSNMVTIGAVRELTPLGQQYVDTILSTYERGLYDGATGSAPPA